MVQLFVQSLIVGVLIVMLWYGADLLLRRAAGQHRRGLAHGQDARCVQPLDLTDR